MPDGEKKPYAQSTHIFRQSLMTELTRLSANVSHLTKSVDELETIIREHDRNDAKISQELVNIRSVIQALIARQDMIEQAIFHGANGFPSLLSRIDAIEAAGDQQDGTQLVPTTDQAAAVVLTRGQIIAAALTLLGTIAAAIGTVIAAIYSRSSGGAP